MVGQYIQKKEEEKQSKEEQAAKARYWKIPVCYDDDDDENYTISITPKEPDNSLSMGDEHLDTIPVTKSNEFIKSSFENLVPNPRNLFEPPFDEKIISMKIDPRHFNAESDLIESLLNRDSPIISSSLKIDSLFDEFAGELTLLKSIPPGINETDCDPEEEIRLIKRLLYDNSSPRPPKEFIFENSDAAIESFSLFPIPVKLIYLLLRMTQCRRALRKMTMTLKGIFSSLKNCLAMIPFHFLKMSHFILIFLHPLILLQNHRMEKSPNLLSHLGHKAFQPSTECPMMINGKNTPILDVLFFYFYPP
nr:hypothetical protein [Tanacetum cinerariifolium]